jgi:hypothetical protein
MDYIFIAIFCLVVGFVLAKWSSRIHAVLSYIVHYIAAAWEWFGVKSKHLEGMSAFIAITTAAIALLGFVALGVNQIVSQTTQARTESTATITVPSATNQTRTSVAPTTQAASAVLGQPFTAMSAPAPYDISAPNILVGSRYPVAQIRSLLAGDVTTEISDIKPTDFAVQVGLNRYEGFSPRHFGMSIVVSIGDGISIAIPMRAFRSISQSGAQHTVKLNDGSTVTGTINGTVVGQNGSYEFRTILELALQSIPELTDEDKNGPHTPKTVDRWEWEFGGVRYAILTPRLVTGPGYYGSSEFCVRVSGQGTTANLLDFQEVSWADGKTRLKAHNGTETVSDDCASASEVQLFMHFSDGDLGLIAQKPMGTLRRMPS